VQVIDERVDCEDGGAKMQATGNWKLVAGNW